MLKRRTKKYTGSLQVIGKHKFLICKECSLHEVEVGMDIKAVTCAYCVQKMIIAPLAPQRKPEGERFPRGWHFKMHYVAPDGRLYSKGVLVNTSDAQPTSGADVNDTPSAPPPKSVRKSSKKLAKKIVRKRRAKNA